MKSWLGKLLFNWVFELLCRLMQGMLWMVSFVESFFDVFAGTTPILYKGENSYLISVFFGHDTITNAFWAMALIAIVMAFGFAIFNMARRATDVTGTMKQSVGQIFSSFIRALLVILLINAMSVAAINISNVLLESINYAMKNASVLDSPSDDRGFSEQEYATMTRILATVGNYSVNPSADSRYNINSCFNAVRGDLLALSVNGFFDYTYPTDDNGHQTWQSALQLLATSADLTQDLPLNVYNEQVAYAVQTVSREISTYSDFAALKTAPPISQTGIDTATTIFLIATMEACNNSMYNGGDFEDALRIGYTNGKKDYMSLSQVKRDFDLWEIDYFVAYLSCIVFFLIMCICIFTFVVRLFNLLLLYLVAPLFASSMPLDEGGKFQSWTQAFVIQLFSGFGSVIAMRLYLIVVPIACSRDLVYFPNSSFLNYMARLFMILGGAWAVLQASGVITGILAGNPGMAAIQNEGRIGAMVTGAALRAPRAAMQSTGKLLNAPRQMAQKTQQHRANSEGKLARKAFRSQNKSEAAVNKANEMRAKGAGGARMQRAEQRADRAVKKADTARERMTKAYGAHGSELSIGQQGLSDRASKTRESLAAARTSRGGGGDSGDSDDGGSGSSVSGNSASGGSGGSATPPPPPSRASRNNSGSSVSGSSVSGSSGSSGTSVPGGGSATRTPPPPPPPRASRNSSGSSTSGSSVSGSSASGSPVSGSSSGSGTSVPGSSDTQAPPPPPPPRASRNSSDSSVSGSSASGSSVSGSSGSSGTSVPGGGSGTQAPPPPPPPRASRNNSDSSVSGSSVSGSSASGSSVSGSSGGSGTSVPGSSGTQAPPPPPPPPPPRASRDSTGSSASGSSASGSSTSGNSGSSGTRTPPPPPPPPPSGRRKRQ